MGNNPAPPRARMHTTNLQLFWDQYQRLKHLQAEKRIVRMSDFIRAAINEKLDRVEGRK